MKREDHGRKKIFHAQHGNINNVVPEAQEMGSHKKFPARGCTMSSIHLIKRPS
jgi:hypothetical protein